jgi:hypothetical protein
MHKEQKKERNESKKRTPLSNARKDVSTRGGGENVAQSAGNTHTHAQTHTHTQSSTHNRKREREEERKNSSSEMKTGRERCISKKKEGECSAWSSRATQ